MREVCVAADNAVHIFARRNPLHYSIPLRTLLDAMDIEVDDAEDEYDQKSADEDAQSSSDGNIPPALLRPTPTPLITLQRKVAELEEQNKILCAAHDSAEKARVGKEVFGGGRPPPHTHRQNVVPQNGYLVAKMGGNVAKTIRNGAKQ